MLSFRDGIKNVDMKRTFGELTFCGMLSESVDRDDAGNATGIKKRTYTLLSEVMKEKIMVGIPAEAGEKQFRFGQLVQLKGLVMDTIAEATFRGVDNTWFMKAADIVPVGAAPEQPRGRNPEAQKQEQKPA